MTNNEITIKAIAELKASKAFLKTILKCRANDRQVIEINRVIQDLEKELLTN